MTPQEEKEFAELQLAWEANNPHWKNKPMKLMSTEELQQAKIQAQKKIYYFFKKMCTFEKLVENLDKEAHKRDAVLEDLPRQYSINNSKSKIK